jgi:hypothetical protein
MSLNTVTAGFERRSRVRSITTITLDAVQSPKDHRVVVLFLPLVLAILLAGCGDSAVGGEDAIQSRWHRVTEPNVHDPFQTLASEYVEFRPQGLLVSLVFDQVSQTFRTTMAGEYAISAADQVTIKGKCWQGWRSHDCSERYRFDLQGDRLTVSDSENDERRVVYERMGGISSDPPPTLIPPMPSATPAGE